MPDAQTVLALVFLAEPAAVVLVAHQLVALDLVAQVQSGRASAELLEDHQVDAVGVHLERHGQVLPAEVSAQPIDQSGNRTHHRDGIGVGLDVGRREQAGLERVAEDPERLRDLRAEVQRVLDVGSGLQDATGPAQQRLQPALLPRSGIGRGQRARSADLAVQLVEQQLHRRHADEAGPKRLGEHPLHLGLFAARGPLAGGGRAVESHDGGPHVGVPDERGQVGAERQLLQRRDVFLARRPRLVAVDRRDDVFAGDGFDPAEQVTGLSPVDVDGRQGAGTEHHRRHSVAQRFRERRAVEHLDVVMGVDVEQAGQYPLTGGIEHPGAVGRVEFLGRDGDDVAVADADVADRRGGARAVEPAAVPNDRVVRHRSHRTGDGDVCQRNREQFPIFVYCSAQASGCRPSTSVNPYSLASSTELADR